MLIDAKNMIVGRIGTIAAKHALLGENIEIINCDEAVITGKKNSVIKDKVRRYNMGTHTKGPFVNRMPNLYVKRIIRGMLPYKQEKGKLAFKRIMCYNGVPTKFEGKKTLKTEFANVAKTKNNDFLKIKTICKNLGAKL